VTLQGVNLFSQYHLNCRLTNPTKYTLFSHFSKTGSQQAPVHSKWRPPGVLVKEAQGRKQFLSGSRVLRTILRNPLDIGILLLVQPPNKIIWRGVGRGRRKTGERRDP